LPKAAALGPAMSGTTSASGHLPFITEENILSARPPFSFISSAHAARPAAYSRRSQYVTQ
jgi:hypothetical protein